MPREWVSVLLLHSVLRKALIMVGGWCDQMSGSVRGIESCLGTGSRAATAVYYHWGDLAVDDLLFAIEVKHVDGRHLGGGAAGPGGASWIGLVHQMGVGIFLHVYVVAFSWTVIRLITFWSNNPVPAEVLEVHSERVPAALRLWRILVAVQPRVPPDSLWALWDFHLHEGELGVKETKKLVFQFTVDTFLSDGACQLLVWLWSSSVQPLMNATASQYRYD